MKQTQTIPATFLGVGYTRDRAGLPLEAVRVPVPQPAADQFLIRVAPSSLNLLEYKLALENELVRHVLEGQLFPGDHPAVVERKLRF